MLRREGTAQSQVSYRVLGSLQPDCSLFIAHAAISGIQMSRVRNLFIGVEVIVFDDGVTDVRTGGSCPGDRLFGDRHDRQDGNDDLTGCGQAISLGDRVRPEATRA